MSAASVVTGGTLIHRSRRVSHANAKRSWNERESLVLRLSTDGDPFGLGEASPLPGYSRDDLATCRAELDGCWSRVGAIDPDAPIRTTLAEASTRAGVRAPAAVFALETAVLDLVARMRGRPAWSVLRGDDSAAAVPLSALAEGADVETLARSAEAAAARGLSVVKAKIGGRAFADDVARLEAIRARAGDAVKLRLDANGSLDAASLASTLAELSRFGVELVEEPAPASAWDAIRETPVSLAMDESLMVDGADDRLRSAVERGACAAVVLKPMALGGFLRSLHFAELAGALGAGALVTHLFDGPVGSAAAATLALALRGRVFPCGLDAHGRLERAIPQLTATAIVPHHDSGLGLAADAYDGATTG